MPTLLETDWPRFLKWCNLTGTRPKSQNTQVPSVTQSTQWNLFRTDTQRGVLAGLSSERNLRSKIWWFTEFCNSHYVSHFAAFFIVAGTKISIANSCSEFRISFQRKETVFKFLLSFVNKIQDSIRDCIKSGTNHRVVVKPNGGLPIHYLHSYCKQCKQWLV